MLGYIIQDPEDRKVVKRLFNIFFIGASFSIVLAYITEIFLLGTIVHFLFFMLSIMATLATLAALVSALFIMAMRYLEAD